MNLRKQLNKFLRGGANGVNSLSMVTNASTMNTSEKYSNIVIMVIFILFVIFLMVKLYQNYTNQTNNQPYIINGNSAANIMKVIPSNLIPFPNNQREGVAFSYSFWMYINEWPDYNACVLYKGSLPHSLNTSETPAKRGVNYKSINSQCPGIYLMKNTNQLIIALNTIGTTDNKVPLETYTVDNIPIREWVYVTLVQSGNISNLYINGKIKQSYQMNNIPMMNYGNLYINPFSGFSGYVSQMRYFASSLKAYQIERLMSEGPATSQCIETNLPVPPVLNQQYWFI